jgi:hypothetical protein
VSDIERGDDVTVGWNAARDRLGRAVAAAEATLTPSPERIKQVMDERARVLASDTPSRPVSLARSSALPTSPPYPELPSFWSASRTCAARSFR